MTDKESKPAKAEDDDIERTVLYRIVGRRDQLRVQIAIGAPPAVITAIFIDASPLSLE